MAVGNAMKALFDSSHISIQRDDQTRVINRSLPPAAPQPPASSRPPRRMESGTPAPRLDVWLWLVMAVGLFAIAGWLVAYALG